MPEAEFRWTQDSWGPEDEVVAPRASSRNEKLAWFGVIALAVVAFEVTADPALTTALGCMKFGWEEVRLARWLRRTDPDRKRGRICSRFYLAWGLWRVSLVAAAVMLIIATFLSSIEGPPAKGAGPVEPPAVFFGCVLTMLIGFLLSSAVSCFAVISALRHRVRVWVGPEVRWALEDGAWPPQTARRRRDTINWTRVILLTALITGTIFGLAMLLIPLAFVFPREMNSPNAPVAAMMAFMIGVPISILALLGRLEARMIAPTPEACWADAGGGSYPGA